MTNFNVSRFRTVALWDLTINRAFYLRMVIVALVVCSVPTLMDMLTYISYPEGMRPSEFAVADCAYSIIRNCVFMLPFLMGFMFHNFTTKQGRVQEMTLPATNLEKFLWHTLLIVGGSLVAFLCSFILLDILQMLFVAIKFGMDSVHSYWTADAGNNITVMMNQVSVSGMNDIHGAGKHLHDAIEWGKVVALLAYVAFCSTFVLGNALKYKQNIPITILFHFVCAFAMMFVSMFVLVSMTAGNGQFFLRRFFEDYAGVVVGIVFFSAIIIFCWWQSYRLYCHSEITAPRNR